MEQSSSTLLTRAARVFRSPGAWVLLVTVCLLLAAALPTLANVYASGLVQTSSNSLSYILNEDATTNVQVQVWQVGGAMVYSEDLGPQTKGPHTWTWNGKGAEPGQNYTIKIAASAAGYTQWTALTANNSLNNFYCARGVNINKNTGSRYFGRIYVAENGGTTGAGRTTHDGIYILNSDVTDALGQGDAPRTGGITWVTSDNDTPHHVEIGPDDSVYISGYADAQSGIWEGDPDFNTASSLFPSDSASSGLANDGSHGSIPGFMVEGLGDARKIWTVDEDLSPHYDCWEYDIGSAATWTGKPSQLFYDTPFINGRDDVCRGKGNTFWLTQNRSGSANAEASLIHLTVNEEGTVARDWASVPSLAASSLSDPLHAASCVAYDPTHDYVAVGTGNGGKVVIFDYNNSVVLANICTYSTGVNRQVEFDAVGNLYAVDAVSERMYIYSPPDGANSYTTPSYFTFPAFGTERNLTITVTPDGSGIATGAGVVYAGQHKTVTAMEVAGYKLKQWQDASGNVLSTSNTYTFDMPDSDLALTAIFEPTTQRRLSLIGNPTEAVGTLTGGGMYEPGSSVPVSATANNLWEFVAWTTDAEGANVVSTNATFNYTMPSNPTTLYAQYEVAKFNVTLNANPTGSGSPSIDGGNRQTYNTPVTIHAAPAGDGYCFVNWSKNQDGTGIVSRKSDYTFTMPGNDVTLYANYAKALFVENFEGLVSGSVKGMGCLDMNYGVNGNGTDPGIGNGNPWWGTDPPNASVGVDLSYTGVTAHKGSNAAWGGGVGNGREYANLSYRCNNGSPICENAVYCDWWFYDRLGSTWNVTGSNYCDDALSLVNSGSFPSDTDIPSDVSTNYTDSTFSQKISLGMATDWCDSTGAAYTGFDPTKYQARIKDGEVDGQTSFANGWYNLSVARTVGWHHARIVIGDIDWGNYANPVSFYIDDMSTPAISGTMTAEIRGIEFTTGNVPSGVKTSAKAAMYDDITFGYPTDAPTAPTAASATNISATGITWNWTGNGSADGYRVYDAVTGGNQKGSDLNATATSYSETGLAGNTLYSRWIASYNACVFESTRTTLDPTYTLAAVPVFGTTGNAAINCSLGATKTDATVGQSAVFTAVNGFGTGAAKADKYVYVWNGSMGEPNWTGAAEWTTGDLTFTPSAAGTYYLHLRAVNGANVVNTTSATFGPYTFALAGTAVDKISDLWVKANDTQAYKLSGKAVSGVVDGAFWIEEANRSAAIEVVWSGTPAAVQDHSVDVIGTLSVVAGQRVLTASSVTDNGAITDETAKIKPIVVVERAAGGKAVNADTPSISNGTGLYNIGMLVRIAGNVTSSGTGFFYLDDGSGLTDGTNTGIKVICGSVTVPTSGTKTVTGLVGVDENGKPTLTIRGVDDIQ